MLHFKQILFDNETRAFFVVMFRKPYSTEFLSKQFKMHFRLSDVTFLCGFLGSGWLSAICIAIILFNMSSCWRQKSWHDSSQLPGEAYLQWAHVGPLHCFLHGTALATCYCQMLYNHTHVSPMAPAFSLRVCTFIPGISLSPKKAYGYTDLHYY